jgi:NAD-dependent SIR2 family protein deacetylase
VCRRRGAGAGARRLVGSASDLDPGFLSDPYAAGQRVSGGLADWTVVTRGADGATAHGHESTLHESARPVTPIDTTGAGDCFAAGLVHGLANGLSMARCLALASRGGGHRRLPAGRRLPASGRGVSRSSNPVPPARSELAMTPPTSTSIDDLTRFVTDHSRLFVLTGAGISTASGIPDYRDTDGAWKRSPPVQYGDFVRDPAVRRRYWARSLLGWPAFAGAAPNASHHALANLEHSGHVSLLVTQNVDGLHQAAGSRRVIDLHGRLDALVCLDCRQGGDRHAFQHELETRNPDFTGLVAGRAPDGDADLDGIDFTAFDVPDCPACGGLLKPDVVFLRRGSTARAGRRGLCGTRHGRRPTGDRLLADGLLGLPLRPRGGRARPAGRRTESRPHPRRRRPIAAWL